MDVAKYIGLFLLKNEQCYVTGLGTLQLLKKAGSYDGQFLHPGSQEVVIVPGGNVDESLANFIANNEQISISKASKALKDFSESTRTAIQSGKEVPLPFLGRFTHDDGKVGFITDAHMRYKPEPIAAQRGVSLRHNERPAAGTQGGFQLPKAAPNPAFSAAAAAAPQPEPIEEDDDTGGLNWWRIILVLLILLLLAAGGYYGYKRYFAPKQRSTNSAPAQPIQEIPEYDESLEEENAATAIDSNAQEATTQEVEPTQDKEEQNVAATPVENTIPTEPQPVPEKKKEEVKKQPKMLKMKVVINTYDSKERAYKRKRQLRAYGTSVDVIEEDTNYYFVVMPIQTTTLDKNKVLDSLRVNYNPDGVIEY